MDLHMTLVNPSTKVWQSTLCPTVRNNLLDKLKDAFKNTKAKSASCDSLFAFMKEAEDVENEIYNKADSRAEYYFLVATKIYDIHRTSTDCNLTEMLSDLNVLDEDK